MTIIEKHKGKVIKKVSNTGVPKEEYNALTNQVAELNNQVNNLSNSLANKEEEINNKNNTIDSLNGQVNNLTNDLANKVNEINNKNNAIDSLNGQINNLNNSLTNKTNEMNNGKQLIADAINDETITKDSTFEAMSEAIKKFVNENNGSSDIKDIGCGSYHTMIVKTNGQLWYCGYNNYGQLGIGTAGNNNYTKFARTEINDAKQVFCGSDATFIIKKDNSLWACGDNAGGRFGLGNYTDQNSFVKIEGMTDIKDISIGQYHTLILKNDGTVWGAGENINGQLGLAEGIYESTTFIKLSIENASAISCGDMHSAIVTNNNELYTTGYNNYGQLGLGDSTKRFGFTKVDTDNVKDVSCGWAFTVIVKNDGTVWACGKNEYGRLGINVSYYEDGTSDQRYRKVFTQCLDSNKVNITNVNKVICGAYSTMAIKNDGTVWSCGHNSYGQLCISSTTSMKAYNQTLLNNPKKIEMGSYHAFAMINDSDTINCWGYNNHGQLGKDTIYSYIDSLGVLERGI